MARSSAESRCRSEPSTVGDRSAGTPPADDLTRIAGIGPRIASVLREAGVGTYGDLARAHPSWVRRILAAEGTSFRVHDPSTWARQAELAAAARWDSLLDFQRRLFRGRLG